MKTNQQDTIQTILSELTSDQQSALLESYVRAEFNKKINEIKKNYQDENKRNFTLSNIGNEFRARLLKKLV